MLPKYSFPTRRAVIITALSIHSSLLFAAPAKPEPGDRLRVDAAYGKLPLSFEANQGQTAAAVNFLSRGPGYTLFLTPTQAVLNLTKPSEAAKETAGIKAAARKPTEGTVLRMTLDGANPHPQIGGQDTLPGKVNYLIGKDPKRWRTGIPTYGKVTYQQVYPGIDLVYYGNQRQLEHDFVVAPGADPKRIRLSFEGAKQLSLDNQGNLVLTTEGGQVSLQKPVVYQDIAGVRKPIAGGYVVKDDRVSFQIAAWDRGHPLVIDPVLSYSTYLGGTGGEGANDIAVDASGQAYVTGRTESTQFPTTPGAFQTTIGASPDAFVTKLKADGSGLLYSTYLGGSDWDEGITIASDSSGHAFVSGAANSIDFPTTPEAFQPTFTGNPVSTGYAFVTKLKPDGSGLVYSTYLGTNIYDPNGNGAYTGSSGIDVDTSGQAYVTGWTNSSDFPTTPGAFQTGNVFINAIFVTKFKADGSGLVYSTFLGEGSVGGAITVDSSGQAYVTGNARSSNFPTTPGAFQTVSVCAPEVPSCGDAFVTKLKADGSGLLYSTYLGGSSDDQGHGIVVSVQGEVFVAGNTHSSNFPTTPGAFQTVYSGPTEFYEGGDAFVTKFKADGSGLLYSTYLGGNGDDGSSGIALDVSGQALVSGRTTSGNFPTTPGAFQTVFGGGGSDAFVTKLKADGSALAYSTFLGGNGGDGAIGIALDSSGQAYVTGGTDSSNFPTTPGAFQKVLANSEDAFVTKLWPSANPYCALTATGTDSQGRKYLKVTTQDTDSGLFTIAVTQQGNATVSVPPFTVGTNDPVVVTATKIDQAKAATVALRVTSQDGLVTNCDPVSTEVIRDRRKPTAQTFTNMPRKESKLAVTNGTPGLSRLVVYVNDKKFVLKDLLDGEQRARNLASAMVPGKNNTITLIGRGERGASASVILSD